MRLDMYWSYSAVPHGLTAIEGYNHTDCYHIDCRPQQPVHDLTAVSVGQYITADPTRRQVHTLVSRAAGLCSRLLGQLEAHGRKIPRWYLNVQLRSLLAGQVLDSTSVNNHIHDDNIVARSCFPS